MITKEKGKRVRTVVGSGRGKAAHKSEKTRFEKKILLRVKNQVSLFGFFLFALSKYTYEEYLMTIKMIPKAPIVIGDPL